MLRTARFRFAAPPAALVAAGLLSAQSAGAADYCVAPNTTCGGANVATFQGALDLAANAPGADRIFLGATTYTAPVATGFDYLSGPVEISGQGAGKTTLSGPPFSSGKVLMLIGGAGTYLHDLTVRVPVGVSPGFEGLVTNGVARRIQVVEDQGQLSSRYGVGLTGGGALEDSTVTMGSDSNATGVLFDSIGGAVRNSIVVGGVGIESRYGGVIERSRVRGSASGVIAGRDTTKITSSLVRATASFATGISALAQGGEAQVQLDGVAIDGPGDAGTQGVFAADFPDMTRSVTVTIKNSLIRRFGKPLNAAGFGSGSAHITASYSDYDASTNTVSGANAGITATKISNVGDQGFSDPAVGNYHLLAGSPLVDAGDPATVQALDLDGRALVADGNADGTARRDIGPFELPAPVAPPTAGGGGAPPATGAAPAPPSAGTTAIAPVTGAGAPARDTQRPNVSGFRASPKVFAVRGSRAGASGRAHGTRFRYTLSERARVTIRIQRGSGKTIAALSPTGAKGANTLRFSGRIMKRALKRGSYRAVITATDAAGNRSAAKRTAFRVA